MNRKGQIWQLTRIKEAINHYIGHGFKSQKELAEKMGYSEMYLSQVLNGRVPLSTKFVERLKRVCPDLNKEYLNGNNDWMFTNPEQELTDFEKALAEVIMNAKRVITEPWILAASASDYLLNEAKKELMKDFPRWKKCGLNTGQTTLFSDGTLRRNGYEIQLNELDKLQKEE